MSVDHRPISVSIRQGRARDVAGMPGPVEATTIDPSPHLQSPAVDIHEGPEGLVLEADLPGVASEDLTIQVEDNVLSLHGPVRGIVPAGARVVHEEFRPADFHRSFILSDEVDRSKIVAELKNGVLRLTLPKAERVKTRRIEIQSS